MKATIHRKSYFNAAHRLYNKNWTDEKNIEVFGKCSNKNFHGHNYNLIVSITGEIDAETGFVMSIETLKKIIFTEVEEYLDHKNLNIEVEEFKELNPTAENIAMIIYNRLRKQIPQDKIVEITLFETERNFVTYKG